MEDEALIVESIGKSTLDLFTIEELKEKGINESNFKWKFNSKNINLIPILELYNNRGIYKTIESIEFSNLLQKVLREVQELYNYNDELNHLKIRKDFIKYLDIVERECSECELRSMCFLGDDEENE